MIEIANFQLDGDGYGGWICRQMGEIKNPETGTVRVGVRRTTYHPSIESCCTHIANVDAAACESVSEVLNAWDGLVKQIRHHLGKS